MFPRLLEYKFTFNTTYIVPTKYVGRPDLIAYELYGDTQYYKPLCVYNNILLGYGVRSGINNVRDAYTKELRETGEYTDSEIELMVSNEMDEMEYSDNYWDGYKSNGNYSDLYDGRLLYIPTQESCNIWLNIYKEYTV